jgi:hypothetical protein
MHSLNRSDSQSQTMSQRARAANVNINNVSYAPVGDRRDSEIEAEAEYVDQDSVPDLFRYYIEEIVIKGDVASVTHGIFDSNSTIEQLLQDCLDNDTSQQRLLDITRELAKRLNDQMPAAANQGVLFIARSTVSGGNIGGDSREVISLLKLDTEEDQRLILSDEGIGAVDESNAFPPHEQLQKGAVYPTTGIPPAELTGDIKIFQSSDSNYFEQFFQCSSTVPSSIEQGRTVLDIVDDAVNQELNRGISSEDISNILEKSERNGGIVNNETLGAALSDITGEQYTENEVDTLVSQEGLSEINIRQDKVPQVFRRTIYTNAGEVTVKHHSATDGNVEVSEDNDGVVVRILGNNHTREYVER